MSHFSEMDWNSKWDWENFVGFGSKTIESPKKLQLADWMIVDDGETVPGSCNLSGTGGSSGASGSDDWHGSSAKSSISASTDSSQKTGVRTANFRFMTFEGSSTVNISKKMEMKESEVSGLPLVSSVGTIEPLIGLKLRKRTFFKNSTAAGDVNPTLALMPTPSSNSTGKKTKSSANAPIPRCQVEGCNIDLSRAKEYHRKHRICDSHSKCPKVVVGGHERRFCQQCSRFHSLSEFDEKKRSCRRRLSDHNARRRKPQQDTIHFNSTRLSSPFYGGRQPMNFMLNNGTVVNSRTPTKSTWDSTRNAKFTVTKGYATKFGADVGDCEQLSIQGIKMPHDPTFPGIAANGHLTSKTSVLDIFNPASVRSPIPSHLDAAPEYRRALSLLSSNSWVSCGAQSIPVHHLMHENGTIVTQPQMHSIPEAVPLPSSEFWPSGLQSAHSRGQAMAATSNNFQDIQLFRTPYESDFYSNTLN